MRPNRPVFGSVTTMTSASPTATPSWSSASSVASAMVFPATSTHSTLYRAFLVLLDRERGCSLGTTTGSISASFDVLLPLPAFAAAELLPLVGRLPFGCALPFAPVFPVVCALPFAPFVRFAAAAPLFGDFAVLPVAFSVPPVAFAVPDAGFPVPVFPVPVPIAFCGVPLFGGAAAPPISRSAAATGVTIPVRNIISCVPILMADETTM
jgi:hypothetical protein